MAQSLLIVDAGPLIALAVADVLPETIALYQTLWVPQAVIDECLARSPHSTSLPGAAAIRKALRADKGIGLHTIPHADIAPLDAAYALGLGTGEAAVISYAAQHQHIALIDDRKARKIAALMQVKTVGSGAVLLALKASGHIAQIAPALAAWQAHGYFVAPAIANELLRRAGESEA